MCAGCVCCYRLYDMSLEVAQPATAGQTADAWGVEACVCPPEYQGLSCQVCTRTLHFYTLALLLSVDGTTEMFRLNMIGSLILKFNSFCMN